MRIRSVKLDESGSAIMQVFMLSIFILILAYALSDFLGHNDNNSRKIIDRTVYLNTGTDTADDLSNVNTVHDTQNVNTDTAYE